MIPAYFLPTFPMTKYPLIREAVKENGGVLPSALVLSVRNEGNNVFALLIEKDEAFYEDSVQTEGYEPPRADRVLPASVYASFSGVWYRGLSTQKPVGDG
jgi:hypothetical protein